LSLLEGRREKRLAGGKKEKLKKTGGKGSMWKRGATDCFPIKGRIQRGERSSS